jgi:hypothetical protein
MRRSFEPPIDWKWYSWWVADMQAATIGAHQAFGTSGKGRPLKAYESF